VLASQRPHTCCAISNALLPALTPRPFPSRRTSPTGLSAATKIGQYVTVGAGSVLRSCRVDDHAVIGERCVLMEGSVVKSKSVLQPGTVLPPGKLVPSGQLWGGNPAAYVRDLTHDEVGGAVKG